MQNQLAANRESSTIGISERQLRAFITVATTLSYAEAGEQLHYTQSAVYLQVKALERLLGCKLLERSGRGLRLTSTASVLLPACRSALAEIDRIEHISQRVASARRLTIASGLVTGCYLMPALIREFSRSRPDILVSVLPGPSEGVLKLVADGSADLGIAAGLQNQPLPEHFSLVYLLDEPYSLLTSDAMSLTPRSPAVIYTIHRDPAVMSNQLLQLEGLGIATYELRALPSADAVKGACLAGQGYGMLIRRAASLELQAGMLREIEGFSARVMVWCCHPPETELSAEARAFLAFLAENQAQLGRILTPV